MTLDRTVVAATFDASLRAMLRQKDCESTKVRTVLRKPASERWRGKGGVGSSFRAGFAGQDDRVSGLGDWVHGRGCTRQVASACVGEWAGAPMKIGATERGDL